MQIVRNSEELEQARAGLTGKLALVPTMGALHAGHMLPALAMIFLSQQVSFFSQVAGPGPHSAERVKIAAWLVLSVILLAALASKGFWLQPKEVRDLIDDEYTRANRNEAMSPMLPPSM